MSDYSRLVGIDLGIDVVDKEYVILFLESTAFLAIRREVILSSLQRSAFAAAV